MPTDLQSVTAELKRLHADHCADPSDVAAWRAYRKAKERMSLNEWADAWAAEAKASAALRQQVAELEGEVNRLNLEAAHRAHDFGWAIGFIDGLILTQDLPEHTKAAGREWLAKHKEQGTT